MLLLYQGKLECVQKVKVRKSACLKVIKCDRRPHCGISAEGAAAQGKAEAQKFRHQPTCILAADREEVGMEGSGIGSITDKACSLC